MFFLSQEVLMSMYRILIVDDEFYIRDGLMSFSWESLGFSPVHSAANAKEALEYIEKNDIDVLLTDIKMPAVDGIQLCSAVREKRPGCRLVLISDYKDFDYSKQALRIGVYDYILKPIDIEELEETFKKLKRDLDEERRSVGDVIEEIEDDHQGEALGTNLAVQKAIAYIKRNYKENISLEFIADRVYLSPSYFCSQFKKETGRGFSDYMNEIRIKKAKLLLEEMNFKAYEIAEMVGYHSPKYFAGIFRRYTGMTALEYRKKMMQHKSPGG